MSSYNAKVYMPQGATQLVVDNGGSLQVLTGGMILPNSGTQAAHVANATNATDVITQLNAVIAALQAIGVLAAS